MSESVRPVRSVLAFACLGVLAAATLAGCGGGSSGPVTAGSEITSTSTDAGGSATPSASVTLSAAPSPTGPSTSASSRQADVGTGTPAATAAPTGAPTAGQPADGKPVIMLQTDGLGVLVGASSIRQFPFGTTTLATLKTVFTNALGTPRTAPNPECGQGPRTTLSSGGFSALFDGTKFVGWVASGPGSHPYSTANGIRIGSTLAAVRKAYGPATVSNDSLGPEFSTPSGLGGLLTSTADSGKVTSLYAGETCFFR